MIWLILSVILGALGQYFFKVAAVKVMHQEAIIDYYVALARNINLWLGFACYGISFLIWLRILTYFDLSYARPFVGLGYVITAIMAWLLLDERISVLSWIGIALITVGVGILSLAKNQ